MDNLRVALVALYAAILTFLTSANLHYNQNTAKRFVHAIVKPDEVLDYIQNCRELEDRVFKEAATCESMHAHVFHESSREQVVQGLKHLLKELQDPIVRIDDRVKMLWDTIEEAEQFNILCWISPIPYEENHRTARGGRVANTCQWLLMHEVYCQWRRSSASSMLWLHGIRESPLFEIVLILTKCQSNVSSWGW